MQIAHIGIRYPCHLCDYKATEKSHLRQCFGSGHNGNLFLDLDPELLFLIRNRIQQKNIKVDKKIYFRPFNSELFTIGL